MAFTGFISSSIQGSGVAKTEARTVADFTELDVGAAINVELAVGPATKLEITADDNLLSHVKTELVGDRLKISMDGSTSSKLGIKVKASTPALKAYQGSGATTAAVAGIKVEQFKLKLSGASKCTLRGEATTFSVDCSGASNAETSALTAKTVKVEASGASTVTVQATEELIADASGASTIRYSGTPVKVKKDASGASTIAPRN